MMFTFMLSAKKGSALKVENGSANIVTLDKISLTLALRVD
jgi:hypothetical protein